MNPLNILLVEDDEHCATIVQTCLTAQGCKVIHTRNGHEALAAYDPQLIQLVLTDLVMPTMEGVELIFKLRKVHPGVKIIAMSGGGHNPPEVYLNIAAKVGAVKTLIKPFTMVELKAAVEACMAAGDAPPAAVVERKPAR